MNDHARRFWIGFFLGGSAALVAAWIAGVLH